VGHDITTPTDAVKEASTEPAGTVPTTDAEATTIAAVVRSPMSYAVVPPDVWALTCGIAAAHLAIQFGDTSVLFAWQEICPASATSAPTTCPIADITICRQTVKRVIVAPEQKPLLRGMRKNATTRRSR
jgi:hypothetical protein